ncbi:hypothetical protein ACFX2I_015036 [Malus domestica]
MELESMKHEAASPRPDQPDKQRTPDGTGSLVSEDKTKITRHPRWTRQETFVLIEGKRVVENVVQRGRRSTSALGTENFESKWDLVSSYCRQRGVSRWPVQCRKRWSNLLVDFKKIRNWEAQINQEAESFWVMRNDVRRQRRLPGFFDREVYNVLVGKEVTAMEACPLALFMPGQTDVKDGDGTEDAAAEEEDEEEGPEKDLNGSRDDMAEDRLSSDFEESGQDETAKKSKNENLMQDSPTKTVTTPMPNSGVIKEKRSLGSKTSGENVYQEKWKQRRVSTDESEHRNIAQLIKVLERNSNMLNAQLEAHNINCHFEREQRKEQNNSILAALGKVTDVLARIADKL